MREIENLSLGIPHPYQDSGDQSVEVSIRRASPSRSFCRGRGLAKEVSRQWRDTLKLNALRSLNDTSLAGKLTYISSTIVAAPATFGLTAPQAASLEASAEVFATSIVDAEEARGAFQSAIEVKDNQRESSLELFGQLLNLMYAQPAVTPGAIASLTLDPRSTTKTPVVPSQPQDFLATPFADGTVKLSWKPGANKYGVVYEVEAADADESNWAVVATTTKSRITVAGFEAGTPKWFRVRATKNGQSSVYSFNSGIYIPIPGAPISLAA